MAKANSQVVVRGNFLGGQFHLPTDVQGEWIHRSPADFSDELGKIPYSYVSIDEGVQSAQSAFQRWRKRPLVDRARFLKNYQAALKRREADLVEMISREVGKPFWESKTEVSAMYQKIDITLNEGMRAVTDFEIPQIMDNTVGVCRYRPLGVMAVVGPFNFPGHLANGHIVPALLTGNTVIFKPSEKTPLVGQIMAECFQEAEFPEGVFNLVQGEKEVGRRLCVHEGVAGVLFTGSYEVGTRIKQDTLHQHWKLLALEMGGKNSAIVWDDVPLDSVVYEILLGAFLTTGQRCSATSRVVVKHSLLDEFVSALHKRAKAFEIGPPAANPFMGPLIDQSSVDRYMKFLGIANREGCEVVMRGKPLDLAVKGNYVAPSICLARSLTVDQAKKSTYQQTEIFGPNVVVIGVDDLQNAIAQANCTQYGLVTSVFSRSRDVFQQCLEDLEMGLVNWNKSTVGASSRLPFGGLKKSGNHFPTALAAASYCTSAVASLETAEMRDVVQVMAQNPGLNWK